MGDKESKFKWKLLVYGVVGAGIGFAFSMLFIIPNAIEDFSSIGLTLMGVSYTLSALCIVLTIGGAALGLTLVYLAKPEE